ncbi:MAG: hypothetical protein GX308_08950 [Epulopiscium sp.]|nr:hypothetical protein [Candidatus Epulonipiscium sp.]
MIEEEKIKLMSKLAVYEKSYGTSDEKINKYYKSDYVYIQNWWSRISAVVGGILLIGLMLFHKIVAQEINVFDIDYRVYGTWIGIFMVILIVFYSLLSTYVYGKRYENAQGRINNYLQMLRQLDEYKPSNQQEEVKEEAYEPNLSNSRDDNRLL